MSQSTKSSLISCPVCNREFQQELIEEHVNKCLFLNTPEQSGCKRDSSFLKKSISPVEKRLKLDPVSTSKHQQIKVKSWYFYRYHVSVIVNMNDSF